jgi:hypothetical protein
MIRIGLSGTNWTRKTTTIQKVVEVIGRDSVDVVTLGDLVARCPYPMGPLQTFDGTRWMADEVSAILDSNDSRVPLQIFDRTPLDIFAFTLYVATKEGEEEVNAKSPLLSEIGELASRFDRIFLCRPWPGWPEPVTPDENRLAFATLMDEYLHQAATECIASVDEIQWPYREFIDMATNCAIK